MREIDLENSFLRAARLMDENNNSRANSSQAGYHSLVKIKNSGELPPYSNCEGDTS